MVVLSAVTKAQSHGPLKGYAIVRADTIHGDIEMNFDIGSVMVHQDSINRMFMSEITQVIIFAQEKEVYIPVQQDEHTVFSKVLVSGEKQLLEIANEFYGQQEEELIKLEDIKSLFEFFDKKSVKKYVFVRNIQIEEKEGLMDVFNYFNSHL